MSKSANSPDTTATPAEPIDLCALWIRTFHLHGLDAMGAAGLLGISGSNFTKTFSRDWPKHNPTMKKLGRDRRMLTTFTTLLAADLGLTIAADTELVQAKVALADAHLHLVKVATR